MLSGPRTLVRHRRSNRPLTSDAPQIAASGPNVYVVWRDEFDAKQGNVGPLPGFLSGEILFKASKDNGTSFLAAPDDPPVKPP